MPATEAQVDSLIEDIRALSDTVSEILITVKGHTTRLDRLEGRVDKVEGRLDKMDRRLDGMDNTLQEILALVKRG